MNLILIFFNSSSIIPRILEAVIFQVDFNLPFFEFLFLSICTGLRFGQSNSRKLPKFEIIYLLSLFTIYLLFCFLSFHFIIICLVTTMVTLVSQILHTNGQPLGSLFCWIMYVCEQFWFRSILINSYLKNICDFFLLATVSVGESAPFYH